MPGHGGGDLRGVQRVGGDHREAGLGRELARVTRQHGDGVAAAQQFGEDGGADKTCGANQCDFHGDLRCVQEGFTLMTS